MAAISFSTKINVRRDWIWSRCDGNSAKEKKGVNTGMSQFHNVLSHTFELIVGQNNSIQVLWAFCHQTTVVFRKGRFRETVPWQIQPDKTVFHEKGILYCNPVRRSYKASRLRYSALLPLHNEHHFKHCNSPFQRLGQCLNKVLIKVPVAEAIVACKGYQS